jgi:exosortase/archaeosortase family protein
MLINLLRIVSLFFVGVYYPNAFNMIHEGVWQAAFVVLAIVFWAVWVQWATRKDRERPDAQPQETTA